MKLPAQAVVCTLSEIFPSTGDTWTDCTEVDDSFNKKGYQCVFQGYEDEKRVVSLSYEGMLIADDLVAKGLAARTLNAATNISEDQAEHIPGIEHNLGLFCFSFCLRNGCFEDNSLYPRAFFNFCTSLILKSQFS